MCIENADLPTPQDLKRKTAYKVLYRRNDQQLEYIWCANGEFTIDKNEWQTAFNHFTDNLGETHKGFHIFKNLKHAKMYAHTKGRCVFKIKIKGITKRGTQEIFNHAPKVDNFISVPILLVDQYKIIKEIPP